MERNNTLVISLNKMKPLRCCAFIALALGTVACTSKGGVSYLAGTFTANFSLTSINNVVPARFNLYSNAGINYAVFQTTSIQVSGACDRGVSQLQFAGTGIAANTTYPCPPSGIANFTVSATAGYNTWTITPQGANGNPTGAATTVNVFAKTAPQAPSITLISTVGTGDDGSNSFSAPVAGAIQLKFSGSTTGSLHIQGTYSGNPAEFLAAVPVSETTSGFLPHIAPGGGWISDGGGIFEEDVTISEGQNYNFTYYVTDITGAESSPLILSVSTGDVLTPARSPVLAGASAPLGSGGKVNSAQANGTFLNAFTIGPIATGPGFVSSSNGGHPTTDLYLGVSNMSAQGPE